MDPADRQDYLDLSELVRRSSDHSAGAERRNSSIAIARVLTEDEIIRVKTQFEEDCGAALKHNFVFER